jgi:anti-sigma B factor antagonist
VHASTFTRYDLDSEMSDLLNVTTELDSTQAVVRASGEIDVSTSDQLEAAIVEAVAGGPTDLVLDLREVSFIDSTGIRCLLRAAELCEQRSIAFRVRPSTAVQRLADLTGITDRVTLE